MFVTYWNVCVCVCVILQIRSQRSWIQPFSDSSFVFSKSISVPQLAVVPPGSHTSLHSRLPAASNWKMKLSGLEGYMNSDSLTPPFVWLRWIRPDSRTAAALRQGLHCGQNRLDTHSSKTPEKVFTVCKKTAGILDLLECLSLCLVEHDVETMPTCF